MAVAVSGTLDINRKPAQNWEYRYWTAGMYQATQADVDLNLCADRPIVVEQMYIIMAVKPSVGSNFTVWYRLGGTDLSAAAVVTAARKVTTTVDLNTVTALVLTKLAFDTADGGVPNYNIIQPGDSYLLDFATTTSMVDFKLIVRYRLLEMF